MLLGKYDSKINLDISEITRSHIRIYIFFRFNMLLVEIRIMVHVVLGARLGQPWL